MVEISAGKLERLKKLSDRKGLIRAAAMDQRGSLQKSIAKAKGVETSQVTPAMMSEFKTAVTKVLSSHASGILLDPTFGLPAAKARDKGCGLLLAYEETGYEQNTPGRVPRLISDYSVRRLLAEGAEAVKLLAYYHPDEKREINAIKHAFVERVGAECAFHQVPFFLEFVGYDLAGGEAKDAAYAKTKPEIVRKSVVEFTQDRYHVDVLKVEIPVDMNFVKGSKACKGESIWTKDEAKKLFKTCADAATKPIIYLSAGVDDAVFIESMELANDSGVTYAGVLCGRATWKEGIPVYAKEGAKALEKWLSDKGVANIEALNKVLEKGAKPWHAKYGGEKAVKAVGAR